MRASLLPPFAEHVRQVVSEGACGGFRRPPGRKNGVEFNQFGVPVGKDLDEVAIFNVGAAAPHHR